MKGRLPAVSKKKPCRSADEFPTFDPKPSAAAGAGILKAAGVPFALVGRVAVWMYVPPGGQQFTKDVDLAIPHGYDGAVVEAAREAGYSTSELTIGGVGISGHGVSVDAIHRHPHAARLFTDAVKAAQDGDERRDVEGHVVPVVPKDYLLAMKLIPHEEKDDRDAQELLKTMSAEEYRAARRLVEEYLGFQGTEHLDAIARRLGHAGVEPRYG